MCKVSPCTDLASTRGTRATLLSEQGAHSRARSSGECAGRARPLQVCSSVHLCARWYSEGGHGRGICCWTIKGGFLAAVDTAVLLTLACPVCLSHRGVCACLSEAAAQLSSSAASSAAAWPPRAAAWLAGWLRSFSTTSQCTRCTLQRRCPTRNTLSCECFPTPSSCLQQQELCLRTAC